MPDSDIVVSGLVAWPGLGQVELTWAVSDPHAEGLPYLSLDQVEVWAATTNNRANASKVREGLVSTIHTGLIEGSTRYYWVKARNKSGFYGDWFPSSATGGIQGTELIGTLTVPSVAGLAVTPGVGAITAKWTLTDPNSSGLGLLALDAVELHAATTNNRAGAVKVDEGRDKALHTAIVEGTTYFYWVRPRHANGTFGDWFPSSASAGIQATVGFAAGAAHALINGKIVPSVAGNALTVAVKTLSGDDPSSTNPVFVGFRDQAGTYAVRSITAALSFTVSSGSTVGASNSIPFRIWVVAVDNSGTVVLAVRNCSTTTAIFALAEDGTATTVAEGGAGAADSAGVFYAAAAHASKALRTIGFMDWNSGLSAAGTWSATPDVTKLFGVGGRLPGNEVQRVKSVDTDFHVIDASKQIPPDDTLPQNTEGEQIFSTAITPTSPVNILENEVVLNIESASGGANINGYVIALFKDSDANALAAGFGRGQTGATFGQQARLFHSRRAASASEITFKARYGTWNNVSANVAINGSIGSSTRYFGGTSESTHTIIERMA